MLKYFIIAVNLLFGIVYLFTSDVWLRVTVPTEVVAGTEFTVKVLIHKDQLNNFARYQQELPIGLTGSEGESANGIFSFKDQKVKIMWMLGTLPAEEEFEIYYTVHVDATFEGTVDIGGILSYIDENERKNMGAGAVTVRVLPTGSVVNYVENTNDNSNDNSNENDTTNTQNQAQNVVTPELERTMTYEGDAVIVEVLVKKRNNSGSAKIVEKIPDGYEATMIDNKDGIFSFKDGEVKFIWQNLPSDEEFVVRYKLKPIDDSVDLYALKIDGELSYLDNGKTVSNKIEEKDTLHENYIKTLADAGVPENNTGTDTNNDNQNTADNNNGNDNNNSGNNGNNQNQGTNVSNPENGVNYKVQICALQKYRTPGFVKRKRKIIFNDKVNVEAHNGWTKYTVGSFNIYRDARDYRVEIWDKTDATDAFVSAYNEGRRITVQEALMITSNQWVQ